mgnify:FL=1
MQECENKFDFSGFDFSFLIDNGYDFIFLSENEEKIVFL